ncbi:hypothetical protein [Phyllobacterium endophyticum]|jgi:hypothetical protein|uniref:1,4-alpha-glucan branching enzyme n=1 Tax=Phyllobacterium endophyticum TaxID=1149773 RepID=A0A2P7ALT6_9HYPH|nr:hypothetical protein [Phyllobacterium endophyticum]MBB3236263.1 hypothetical protein [Phyllobacterium endophyticum]PSH55181.1 hypothetical protein CU100_24235 [Phyllobacterium endophyticum]TXR49283.1 hypothetical protein FVA77_09835 [Phyllobacterium endophyticum]TYR39813.1 hypothetical protein FY050_19455 [Phyllobacterium endophyticum]
MAETRLLTDHQDIRDWAAGRSGYPAIRDTSELIGNDVPVLSIQFGQHAYEDNDDQGADRPGDLGRPRLVEWDEWFAVFDAEGLGLVVAEDVPGQRDDFHEIIRR